MADRDRFGGSAMSYSRPSRPRGGSTSYQKSWEPRQVTYKDFGRTVGGEHRPGETGRSLGPAGGPTTFKNTYPRTADIFDKHLQGLNPTKSPRYTTDFFEGLNPTKSPYTTDFLEGFSPNIGSISEEGIGSLMPSYIGFDRIGERGFSPNIGFDRMGPGRAFYGDQDVTGQSMVAAVDPSDWRTLEAILGAGGNPDDYIQTAGIMGGLPSEYQVAELTEDQKKFMKNPYFSPNLEKAPSADELFKSVKEMEEKPGYWWNPFGSEGQEPTTREEFDEYYNELQDSYYA
jgi:hypothetical protein